MQNSLWQCSWTRLLHPLNMGPLNILVWFLSLLLSQQPPLCFTSPDVAPRSDQRGRWDVTSARVQCFKTWQRADGSSLYLKSSRHSHTADCSLQCHKSPKKKQLPKNAQSNTDKQEASGVLQAQLVEETRIKLKKLLINRSISVSQELVSSHGGSSCGGAWFGKWKT